MKLSPLKLSLQQAPTVNVFSWNSMESMISKLIGGPASCRWVTYSALATAHMRLAVCSFHFSFGQMLVVMYQIQLLLYLQAILWLILVPP